MSRNKITVHKHSSKRMKVVIQERKKKIFEMMRSVAAKAGVLDAYRLIPASEFPFIERIRFRGIRIDRAPGCAIDKKTLQENRNVLSQLMTIETIAIKNGTVKLTCEEALLAGFTLYNYSRVLEIDEYPGAATVKSAFEVFSSIMKNTVENSSIDNLLNLLFIAVKDRSRINSGFYKLRSGDTTDKFIFLYYLHRHMPKLKTEIIDGIKRTVYQIALPTEDDCKLSMAKPSDLGFQRCTNERPLPVFIQNHALIRLTERLSPIIEGYQHLHLYTSIAEPYVHYTEKGIPLIEYRFLGHKVGYLVPVLCKDSIVIKTFLFLTMSGTPEGNRLNERIQVKKYEKAYLEIDKFKIFQSDVATDQRLRNFFFECGCKSLFDLSDTLNLEHTEGYAQKLRKLILGDDEKW